MIPPAGRVNVKQVVTKIQVFRNAIAFEQTALFDLS